MSLGLDPLRDIASVLDPPECPPEGAGLNYSDILDLLPAGDASLRPAAVLVGLVDRGQGLAVVLTRRNEGLRNHGGQVSFPGGLVEATDADPVAAALREAREEIGLSGAQAHVLGYLSTFTTITGFHVFAVVAEISAEFIAVRDPAEVEEIFEVPLAFLLDRANARDFEIDHGGRVRRGVEFQHSGFRIWGTTAAMLVDLRGRLERLR